MHERPTSVSGTDLRSIAPRPANGSTSVLTHEEIDGYHRDGYLLLDRPVLGRDDVHKASVAIDGLFDACATYPKRRFTGDFRDEDSPPGVSGIKDAATLDHRLAELPLFKICQRIAAELLERRRAWFYFDHVVSKESGANTEVLWHQDFAYSATGMIRRSVHFWVPLMDIEPAHGSMVYLPGSHRSGLQDHELVSRSGEVIRAAQVADGGVELQTVQMGGLVCHDPMTLHYSKSNLSGGVRRAWVLHVGVGTWPALRHFSAPVLTALSAVQHRALKTATH